MSSFKLGPSNPFNNRGSILSNNVMSKRKIPAFPGNQTPVIHPIYNHFTDRDHPADKPRPVMSIKYLYEVDYVPMKTK
jgi:hypothetical protein